MKTLTAGIVAVLFMGCASSHPQQRIASTQPAGRVEAGMQSPTGAVAAALALRRETGSSATSGDHSPTYTVVNSPWPTVAFGLGCGALLILWQLERRHRQRHGRA